MSLHLHAQMSLASNTKFEFDCGDQDLGLGLLQPEQSRMGANQHVLNRP